jgi:hypothetical protein
MQQEEIRRKLRKRQSAERSHHSRTRLKEFL